MELTSFVLGVCAVIVLLMIVGTSVNYMAFKTLKKDFDNYVNSTENVLKDIYKDIETTGNNLYSRIENVEQQGFRHTDSRVDKVINELERIKRNYIKEY